MKKQLFAVLGLGLLLATVSAYAQTINMKVNVPFDFIVSGATLPSGEYTIRSMNQDGSALSIRDANQQAKSLVIANRCESLQPSEQTKLVFHRYGGRYFLAQIWAAGDNSGRELSKSAREAEVAKDYTMHKVVLVAGLR